MNSREELVVIVMGSPTDQEQAEKIKQVLDKFSVESVLRIGSAHKTPAHLLELIKNYDGQNKKIIYIAVAGRSNALGGFIDAQTKNPVISCPPYGEKYGGADIFSSLRMPSGIAATVVLEPETAALAAVKIFALDNLELAEKFENYQKSFREKIVQADIVLSEKNNSYHSPTLQTLETVNLPRSFGPKIQGKVRDNWVLKDGKRLMITTDRQSAFDRIVCLTPGKGRLLNTLSKFWFEKTKDIIPNHMIAIPHPNVTVCTECKSVPIEMIVRAYITGSTSTSLWKNYSEKTGLYDWLKLPKGLLKNQKLPKLVFTPTTKAEGGQHDKIISPSQATKLFGKTYREMEEAAQALFERAARIYKKAGLILVDTKFEFGKDKNGKLVLIDEIFTPDSSRLWRLESYKEKLKRGEEPESLDKEFLRLWLVDHGFSGEGRIPHVPEEITGKLAALYTEPYQRLTGQDLSRIDSSPAAIKQSILDYFNKTA
ncbi:AIR carboxylase family protein [Candidatus Microgenomates bacterium]|nr:AIR carboxylase family protein [Candidatus Microgenomates bacterium]